MTTALVKTALRIKPPQVNEETKELQIVRNENKVCLGEKSFHFDFLYPSYATEQDVYESSIAPLLNRFVEGNNVTLLTYGQADMYPRLDDQGILHQFAYSFFDKLKDAEYQIYASCLELYDEDMIDLLALKSNEQHPVIRKDIQGKLYWQGIREKRAYTAEELLSCFKTNALSTCSHHIFSVLIKQPYQQDNALISKFHFVNLNKIQNKHYIPYNDSRLMCLLEEKGSENDTLLLAHVSSSDDQQTFHILQSTNQWRTRKSKNEDFYSELSQIKMDMMALRDTRSNRYLEDQVKILREEMSTMRSFVYNLTDELTKARTINQPSETKQKSINQTPRVLESPLDEVKSRRIFKEDPDMFKEDPDMFKEDQDMFKEDPNMFKEDQDMFKEDENFSLEKDETNLQLSLENFSFPSCQDISSFEQMDVPIAPSSSSGLLLDEEDTLEELAVPTWSDEGKESTTKRTSISADSLWEDTDSSIATSCVTSTGGTPVLTPSSDFKGDRKQNRKLLRMLHQVQADSLVKRELMGRLEKTEDFYAQMRTHYEDKLNQLRLHLAEVQRERDVAIKRKPMSPTASTPMRERPESVLQLRENRQAEELRSEYQVKVKQLIAENHELRKKNTQITQASRMAQIKSDSMVRQLQEEIEKLSKQTKRKSRELKIETDGAKEASVLYEKEIQQLKRREAVAVEAKKKADEVNEAQSQLIKKRSEETATVNTQMRQLVNMLRKSANAGTFLNEANLEKILNGTFIPTPTNVPSRRSATH